MHGNPLATKMMCEQRNDYLTGSIALGPILLCGLFSKIDGPEWPQPRRWSTPSGAHFERILSNDTFRGGLRWVIAEVKSTGLECRPHAVKGQSRHSYYIEN